MDRLNNISRNGGYPWVAEEISIIEKHADYINAMLDSMKLHGGSCVFVQRNETQQGKLMQSVVYIVKPNETHGELYYIAADNDVTVSSLLDGTSAKKNITITETNQDVTGAQSTTYDDCYITKTAALASGSLYTFYDLNDLLRPAVWTNLTLSNTVTDYSSQVGVNVALDSSFTNQLIRKNNQEIEIRLRYKFTGQYTTTLSIKHYLEMCSFDLQQNKIYPLQCVMSDGSSKLCYITNDMIVVLGLTGNVDDTFYVFGRVSIK